MKPIFLSLLHTYQLSSSSQLLLNSLPILHYAPAIPASSLPSSNRSSSTEPWYLQATLTLKPLHSYLWSSPSQRCASQWKYTLKILPGSGTNVSLDHSHRLGDRRAVLVNGSKANTLPRHLLGTCFSQTPQAHSIAQRLASGACTSCNSFHSDFCWDTAFRSCFSCTMRGHIN